MRAEDDLRCARARQDVEAAGLDLLPLYVKAHLAELSTQGVAIALLLSGDGGDLDPIREVADELAHEE